MDPAAVPVEPNVNDVCEQDHSGTESTINVNILNASTANSHECPTSMITSPPVPPLEAPSYQSQIYRTSSLPGGMNETGMNERGMNEKLHTSSPVQLRLSTSRSRKKAQHLRNSVAVTNSDYLNQWKPQMTQLIHSQSPGVVGGLMRATPSAPSLDTISEHELVANLQPKKVLSPLVTRQQQADPNMFRYTPTPVLDPDRQVVPRPLSRPTTPVPPSATSSRATSSPLLSPNAGYYQPFPVRRESSQAIPLSSDAENQFLPIFINPETRAVYMFQDGYYVPLTKQQLQQFQVASGSTDTAVTHPPAPQDKRMQDDQGQRNAAEHQVQRYSQLFQDVPDYWWFVLLLMILLALCCDLAVLLIFGLPAFICSLKVRKANRIGDLHEAKKLSEYTLCFSIGGIVFHVILALMVIMMFLMLHYIAGII